MNAPSSSPFPTSENPPERNEQLPLGPLPTYDDVLDMGVEYTFPASDPVAVQTAATDSAKREEQEQQQAATPQAGADEGTADTATAGEPAAAEAAGPGHRP